MVSCTMCKFADSSDKKMKDHMIAKHDEREFPCEKYEITVRGRLQLKAHKRKHKEITCKKCRESVPYNSATCHKTKCLGENFKCENCEKLFGSLKRLNGHKKRIHGEKNLKCPNCDSCFSTKGDLNTHIKRSHDPSKNNDSLIVPSENNDPLLV